MSAALMGFGKTTVSAFANGAGGAAVSYFYIGKDRYERVMGVALPEWAVDGLIFAAESVFSDLVGTWGLPIIERKIVDSDMMVRVTRSTLTPAIMGGANVVVNEFREDPYVNSKLQAFLTAAIPKAVIDETLRALYFRNS